MKRACLLILDGAGYATEHTGNAVTRETLPTLFDAMHEHGHAVLEASGQAVGLEHGQVGNSESGHLTLGSGRVIPCMTRRILAAAESGAFAGDPGWKIAVEAGVLHVIGLLSDAGVHGLSRTVVQSVRAAAHAGVARIVVHPVLDGVDSQIGSAPRLLGELLTELAGIEACELGVIIGRKWCCDRSGKPELTRVAIDALSGRVTLPRFADRLLDAHTKSGRNEMEFPAHALTSDRVIRPGDPVLLTSHRADRARQLAGALAQTQPLLMLVDPGPDVQAHHVFFRAEPVRGGIASALAAADIESARIAEKCKFPHVTYFFNGFEHGLEGVGTCIASIPESEIPSQPEMSLAGVSDAIERELRNPARRAIVANIANLDQVGHLGRLDLARSAAMAVDMALARIAETARANGWTLLITADHGNADRVETDDGQPFGSHTDRPVPFVIRPIDGERIVWRQTGGSLANVAATFLDALGLAVPPTMEPSLAVFQHHVELGAEAKR